jgi:hypothetical protein
MNVDSYHSRCVAINGVKTPLLSAGRRPFKLGEMVFGSQIFPSQADGVT